MNTSQTLCLPSSLCVNNDRYFDDHKRHAVRTSCPYGRLLLFIYKIATNFFEKKSGRRPNPLMGEIITIMFLEPEKGGYHIVEKNHNDVELLFYFNVIFVEFDYCPLVAYRQFSNVIEATRIFIAHCDDLFYYTKTMNHCELPIRTGLCCVNCSHHFVPKYGIRVAWKIVLSETSSESHTVSS